MLARDREYRYKQLIEKNLTSQQEYDLQLSELNSVLADVELTEAQIAKTQIVAPFDGIVGLKSISVGSYISPEIKIVSLQSINPMNVLSVHIVRQQSDLKFPATLIGEIFGQR